MKLYVQYFLVISLLLLGSSFIGSSYAQITTRITNPDAGMHDYFGISVGIDGDNVVVGAYRHSVNGIDAGAAYIYKRNGCSWDFESKICASDGLSKDQFGQQVAIEGDYVAVSAPAATRNGEWSGVVYIFKRDSDKWSELAKILPNEVDEHDWFGLSLAMEKNTLVVGAPGDDDNGHRAGALYIFERNGNIWNQKIKLTASDGNAEDNFGASVSINDDYLVVTAPGDEHPLDRWGSVYIFKRNDDTWTEQAKLTVEDTKSFGSSISIEGSYLVVGNPSDDVLGERSGSIHIFKRAGLTWDKGTKIVPSDGAAYDSFGYSVIISENLIAVGANGYYNQNTQGSVYLFKRDGNIWRKPFVR